MFRMMHEVQQEIKYQSAFFSALSLRDMTYFRAEQRIHIRTQARSKESLRLNVRSLSFCEKKSLTVQWQCKLLKLGGLD